MVAEIDIHDSHHIVVIQPNLDIFGAKLNVEPQNEEAVMSESGIFLVSIPRLSMHTGPGTGVKPIHGHNKKYIIKTSTQERVITLSWE